MSQVLAHFKADLLVLLRIPAFSVPTIGFPVLFFLFFGVPNARDPETANLLMASFATFAVLGVSVFKFGVSIAVDRHNPWETYLRSLPATPATRFTARVLGAGVFSTAAAGGVILTAVLTTSAGLDAGRWLTLAAALLLGAVPFALLGITIGYSTSPRGALPVANVIYFALSYLGGLWTPPQHLPGVIAQLSPMLPTRQWGELVWSSVLGLPWSWTALAALLAYSLAFGLLAAAGYRRDEKQHYT